MTGDTHPNPHADDSMVGPHGSMDDHGETDGHDDHAHSGASSIGPVNRAAWVAGVVGILLGLAVAVALATSSGYRPF
ncbi:MAG TPA: hypothetical protein VKC59_02550 [Candidatus Limnocylindrales bacterium]|nr:hypothetical protein [Candidatus Limnocylindrales bacterium]